MDINIFSIKNIKIQKIEQENNSYFFVLYISDDNKSEIKLYFDNFDKLRYFQELIMLSFDSIN
jgi:hypothetical protein